MEAITTILLLSREFRDYDGFNDMMNRWYRTGEKSVPSSLKGICLSALRKQGIDSSRLTGRAVYEAAAIAIRDRVGGGFQRAMSKLEADVKSEKADDRIAARDAKNGQSSMFGYEDDDEPGQYSAEILELFSSVAKSQRFLVDTVGVDR